MMRATTLSLLAMYTLLACSLAFQATNIRVTPTSTTSLQGTRRNVLECITTTVLAGSVVLPQQVLASGGATAGGAYLLSAKQRYNDRVLKGVTGFIGLKALLDAGDINAIRPYFADEEAGSWKDFTAAGYLLANAFRRNSSAAPDSLPSVKKWKAFTAEVDGMTKALKKKDTKAASVAYEKAMAALSEYLEKVELSSALEAVVS